MTKEEIDNILLQNENIRHDTVCPGVDFLHDSIIKLTEEIKHLQERSEELEKRNIALQREVNIYEYTKS